MSADPVTACLAVPSLRHRTSYLEALREGFHLGIPLAADSPMIAGIEADFDGHLRAITEPGAGISLPSGEVVGGEPHSLLWLVEGEAFIGEVNIRHELTAWLRRSGGHVSYTVRPSHRRRGYGRLTLALAIEECRRLGLGRVLVNALEDNLPSIRIIEANGGRFEDVIDAPSGGRLRRYWISL